MILLYFRSSSLGNWEFCQMQYYITYNLGWQSPANKKANLGTVVHKTLEILASMKLILQNSKKSKSSNHLCEDKELGKFEFTKKDLESQKLVDEILLRSYNYYVEHTPEISYTNSDFKFCKQMVENCLNGYASQFDPRKQNIIAPEKSFDLEINEPWAEIIYNNEPRKLRIKGTMDLVTSPDEGVIEYVDYKTGSRKNWATGEEKTYAKLHDDIQLLLYFYALKKIYPEYKSIIMTIFYLRDGGPFSLCFDNEDEKRFLNKLEEKFTQIKNCSKPDPVDKWRSGFKCQRLCHYYKNNWPGTNKTICNHVEDTIKIYGIENATSKLSKPGFNIDFYSAPGAVNKGEQDADSKKK